jgi:membrane protein required for colicin V production
MTWVDGVLLGVIAVSALHAFFRGLVSEALGVGAWIGAGLVALYALPQVRPMVSPYVEQPWLVDAIAAGGVFLVVLIILKIVISWIAGIVQASLLSGLDRVLGLVFGILRGAFLVVLAYIVGGLLLPAPERWPEPVREARALPIVADAAARLVAYLPEEYRPRLPAPPDRPVPTMEELLRPPAQSRP